MSAPTALGFFCDVYPALTGWAKFCRAAGAGLWRMDVVARIGDWRRWAEHSEERSLPAAGRLRCAPFLRQGAFDAFSVNKQDDGLKKEHRPCETAAGGFGSGIRKAGDASLRRSSAVQAPGQAGAQQAAPLRAVITADRDGTTEGRARHAVSLRTDSALLTALRSLVTIHRSPITTHHSCTACLRIARSNARMSSCSTYST